MPTANSDFPLVGAIYWTKSPGHSDGECRGYPSGEPGYPLGLARRSAY